MRPSRAPVTPLVPLLLALAFAGVAGADDGLLAESAPLEVPRGSGLEPGIAPGSDGIARTEAVARALAARGYDERPLAAWALLGASPDGALLGRAVELAPHTPAIRFEAYRRGAGAAELVAALGALTTHVPGLLWLATLLGGVVGITLLVLALALAGFGLIRVLPLHGHAFGHRLPGPEPPGWLGVLLLLLALAALPLFGAGPGLIAAAAGGVAASRLSRFRGVALACALVLGGLVAGPGLDYWARLATHHGGEPARRAAWRVDRAQPLPGDLGRLERALARRPDDALLRLSLATALKREGRIDQVLDQLDAIPPGTVRPLRARAENLRGIAELARGDLEAAIRAFERSRSFEENAAVLYNLSQAYARGMRLIERSAIFQAARDLDAPLVTRYTRYEGDNVHRFVIQDPIPGTLWLRDALAPTRDATWLASDLRLRILGRGAPDRSWLLLPLAAIVGIALRRDDIRRCGTCGRPVCSRCVSMARSTCRRCVSLFAREAVTDPRLHRIQLERHRRRRQLASRGLVVAALLVPGSARLIEGRSGSGALHLGLACSGLALLCAGPWLPVPYGVGALGPWVVWVTGVVVLAVAWVPALAEAARRSLELGRPT